MFIFLIIVRIKTKQKILKKIKNKDGREIKKKRRR